MKSPSLNAAAQVAILTSTLLYGGSALATALSGGSSMNSIGANATGIYVLAQTTANGKQYSTRALICDGKVKDKHTSGGSGYLARNSGSPAITVSTSTFSSLIASGGLNVDVTSKPATVKNAFLTACGMAGAGGTGGTGGSGLPMSVNPFKLNQCPQNYAYNSTTKKCHLLSALPPASNGQWLARLGSWTVERISKMELIGSAHAFIKDLPMRIFVTWKLKSVGTGFSYSYTPLAGSPPGYADNVVGVIEITGAGGTVQWLVTD